MHAMLEAARSNAWTERVLPLKRCVTGAPIVQTPTMKALGFVFHQEPAAKPLSDAPTRPEARAGRIVVAAPEGLCAA
jgi:hypothetical protein